MRNAWIILKNMKRHVPRWACAVLVAAAFALVSGCAPRKGAVSDTLAVTESEAERFAKDYRTAGENRMKEQWAEEAGELVVDTAKAALGTAYVLGGTSLAGFDCSGLVQWAYKHVGVTLPRTAREQAGVGEAITNKDDLRVGDIVAFRHPRRGYHTGIYTGDGQFIHSPRRRSSVKIASLSDPYFRNTFLGARRVSIPDTTDVNAVRERVASYKKEKQKAASAKSLASSGVGDKKKSKARVTSSSKKNSKKRAGVSRTRSAKVKNATKAKQPAVKAASRKKNAPSARIDPRKTAARSAS